MAYARKSYFSQKSAEIRKYLHIFQRIVPRNPQIVCVPQRTFKQTWYILLNHSTEKDSPVKSILRTSHKVRISLKQIHMVTLLGQVSPAKRKNGSQALSFPVMEQIAEGE
jgi:hypothetical protein